MAILSKNKFEQDKPAVSEGKDSFWKDRPVEIAGERIRLQATQACLHSGGIEGSSVARIRKAVDSTCDFFLRTQYAEGYWWSELESNVTITAEYLLLLRLIECADHGMERDIVRYLLSQQNENGAWGLYYGDEGDLSTTIEAYFALKLAGEDPESPPLRRARGFILRRGGIERSRVFTKIWLALFGQYDWQKVPSMPVELVLLPSHFYFSIYELSSWARATVVPLSIVLTARPVYTLPESKNVQELYLPSNGSPMRFKSWVHKLFFIFDRIAKEFEKRPFRRLRSRAIREAEKWILDHQEESGDWGGIQPPMVYSILALHYLGYPLDHPAMVKGMHAIKGFCLKDDQGLRMQSCISPVWDTTLTTLALIEAGISPEHPAIRNAVSWLASKQTTTGGDWQVKSCCPPGGWAFEFVNTRYPDVDDSAFVLTTLHRASRSGCDKLHEVKMRGMEWCLGMQSSSGGWGAFDRDNDMIILNRIPFADQEAMVDYPSVDVTGRVLEAMGHYGYPPTHPQAQRGIQFIRRMQEPDGSWWGRWGVNYIYGTWAALRGLIAIGEDPGAAYIQAAVSWLKAHQNPDGGWGETCESYMNPDLRGRGTSTPSQTAWALMGLMACGEEDCPEVKRGVQYLVDTQRSDGSWEETCFTGTGFPKHFFIRYDNYRNCFPLMALGQYLRKLEAKVSPPERW